MIEVTDQQVLETLREVVAGKEDYVYEPQQEGQSMCLYVHEDEHGRKTPGCLVAHALVRLGGSISGLEESEGSGPLLASVKAGLSLEDASVEALVQAQVAQDSGYTWGEALRVAEAEFGV